MDFVTLEAALKLPGRRIEELEVPELGGKLRLVELQGGRSLEFKAMQAKRDKGEDIERKQMILLLVGSIVDSENKPMLNEKTAGQFIDAISFKTLQLITTKVLQMMTPAEQEKPAEGEAAPAGN